MITRHKNLVKKDKIYTCKIPSCFWSILSQNVFDCRDNMVTENCQKLRNEIISSHTEIKTTFLALGKTKRLESNNGNLIQPLIPKKILVKKNFLDILSYVVDFELPNYQCSCHQKQPNGKTMIKTLAYSCHKNPVAQCMFNFFPIDTFCCWYCLNTYGYIHVTKNTYAMDRALIGLYFIKRV